MFIAEAVIKSTGYQTNHINGYSFYNMY